MKYLRCTGATLLFAVLFAAAPAFGSSAQFAGVDEAMNKIVAAGVPALHSRSFVYSISSALRLPAFK